MLLFLDLISRKLISHEWGIREQRILHAQAAVTRLPMKPVVPMPNELNSDRPDRNRDGSSARGPRNTIAQMWCDTLEFISKMVERLPEGPLGAVCLTLIIVEILLALICVVAIISGKGESMILELVGIFAIICLVIVIILIMRIPRDAPLANAQAIRYGQIRPQRIS